MSRLNTILIALVAVLIGATGAMFISTQQTPENMESGLTESDVREIVAAALAEQQSEQSELLPALPPAPSAPVLSAELIDPMIESYLMGDPKILQRVADALEQQLRREEMQSTRVALGALQEQIYEDADHIILGNPDGDVTLVEFFDYNCGYCRSSMPDMAQLLDTDPNLRIILKEFPILSDASFEAAQIAVALSKTTDIDYWTFHQSLFSARGQIDKNTALSVATNLGVNAIELELAAQNAEYADILRRNYAIAQALNISGTPTYIIGDEILPGAVGFDALRERIQNMRDCGNTFCDDLS